MRLVPALVSKQNPFFGTVSEYLALQNPHNWRRIMYKEDIVFFDQLGFGWAIDKRIILKVFAGAGKNEKVSEKVLFNRACQTR